MSTETWTNKIKYHHGVSPAPPFLLTSPDVSYADALKGKRAPLYEYIEEEKEHADEEDRVMGEPNQGRDE